jgi:hypothetical protein
VLQAFVSLVGVVAFGAWIVAALSLIGALRLVPAGRRASALFSAGFWQFQRVRALGGPGVDAHLQRYAFAFVVFFFAIIASMFLGTMLSIQASDAAAAATTASSSS